jgi:hypothetical protein
MNDIPPYDTLTREQIDKLSKWELSVAIAQTQEPAHLGQPGRFPEIDAALEACKPLGDPSIDVEAYRRRHSWRRWLPFAMRYR